MGSARVHSSGRSRPPHGLSSPSKAVDSSTDQLSRDLRGTVLRLGAVGAVISTVVAALQAQNCERDEDIARCLSWAALDPLHREIDRLEKAAQGRLRQTQQDYPTDGDGGL